VVGLALAVTACTSPKSTDTTNQSGNVDLNAPRKQGGTVTISNEQGQTWPCAFNPFNPANNVESLGFVYEPLVYVDLLNNQAETPMLATGFTWVDDKTIKFAIRSGVKWNDGQSFSAADVAFTFNLMKQNSALDLYALWTGAGLQSVTADGDTVTMSFANPAKSYFFQFANQVGIVPQHIWSTGDAAAHPDTWTSWSPPGSVASVARTSSCSRCSRR
jgi:peptide/nickel transport system substrate-binding protein